MSTVDNVIAVCGQLRQAWRWLSTTPGRTTRNQRVLSDRAVKARNQRVVAERADRPALVNAVKIVGGGQPPADLAVIDARTRIIGTVEDVAGEMTLRVATVRNVRAYRPDRTNTDRRFHHGLDWVSANVQHITDRPILANAHTQLAEANMLARQVAGEGPDLLRLGHECPCCNRRTLYWDTGSVEPREHHIRCTAPACVCTGVDCPCRLPGRVAGMRHAWLSGRWADMAAGFEETA